VIAAPLGSGITSFLTSSVNTFIESVGKARLLGSELRGQDDFHAAFGGEDNRLMLFDILPLISLIVIDQFDSFQELPREVESLIHHLACESRRTAE
jgi:hypothetical protein